MAPFDTIKAVEDIATRDLQNVADALITGAFDVYEAAFDIPVMMSTSAGTRLIASRDALYDTFQAVHGKLRAMGVTRMERRLDCAVPVGDDMIRRSHQSFMFRGDTPVGTPFSSHSVLERRGADWRVTVAQTAVQNPSLTRALMGGDLRRADADTDVMTAFQGALDRMTAGYLAADFDVVRDTVQLPLFVQGSDGTQIIADTATLRAEFDRFMTQVRIHRVTDLLRRTVSAERLGNTRMLGTYRTHVLSGDQLVVPSYMSVKSLERGPDGVWRTVSVMNPLGTFFRIRTAAGIAR